MARVQVNVQINRRAVQALFRDPRGGVAGDMLRRGNNVAALAKKYAPVRTGLLRSSIQAKLVKYNGQVAVIVGTNVHYAMWQHDGTGIYGPHHTPIVPRRAQYLRFIPRGGNTYVYAREVRGTRGTFFLTRALAAAAR